MRSLIFLCLFFPAALARAENLPTLPYYDWGACPFECCTYRRWQATKEVIIHRTRSTTSPEVFRTKKREPIDGVTGVVITTQLGITKILKDVKLGYLKNGDGPKLSLKAGEILYTLHYLGEGFDLFWYQGKVYSDEIAVPDETVGSVPQSDTFKVESHPKTEWWIKVKNSRGQSGWTTEAEAFDHMDACG